jgi:hypothetical protein
MIYFAAWLLPILIGSSNLTSLEKRNQADTSQEMKNVMMQGRQALSEVPTWIEMSSIHSSQSQYGLPEIAKKHMNDYVGDEVTYSDLINYFSGFLKEKIQYVEFGVSVGKNFFQVFHYLNDATVVGVDLERPNKVLEDFLSDKQIVEVWPSFSMIRSLDQEPSWIKRYMETEKTGYLESQLIHYSFLPKKNDVFYLNGNVLDETIYQALAAKGLRFNLGFSDAFHFSDAVVKEYEMMSKYNLFGDEFIMVWDDLHVVEPGFYKIFDSLKKRYPGQVFHSVLFSRGWIGVHEEAHRIGVIFKLSNRAAFEEIKRKMNFLNIVRID